MKALLTECYGRCMHPQQPGALALQTEPAGPVMWGFVPHSQLPQLQRCLMLPGSTRSSPSLNLMPVLVS